jgi:CheY-like chemotaxis protein
VPLMELLVLVETATVRRLIREIVSGVTKKIWECDSSEGISEEFRDLKPDFVLMDIDRRPVHGVSALADVRSMFPAARIIAITSYDHPDLQQSIHSAGADACLAKENLLQLVRLLRWPGPKLDRPHLDLR